MNPRILLTHTPAARALYYGDAENGLRALGDLHLHDSEAPLAGDALIRAAAGCEVIVADRATAFPAEVFAALPDLVAVVRCAVDIRNIDVDAGSKAGALVTHASPGFAVSVAELIIGFMIDCLRGITAASIAYRQGETPAPAMGRQLRGATLGIIGYGTIGRCLAKIALGLGMNVLVNDPYAEMPDDVESVDLDTLLSRSDFVAPLAVATDETENMIDAKALTRMRPTAFLINASRGNLIDEDALEAALVEGRIAGAAMDVGRAPDQMPSPRPARLPNVVATPHIGGLVREAVAHQANETVGQVREILNGRAPRGGVNAAAAARLRRFEAD